MCAGVTHALLKTTVYIAALKPDRWAISLSVDVRRDKDVDLRI